MKRKGWKDKLLLLIFAVCFVIAILGVFSDLKIWERYFERQYDLKTVNNVEENWRREQISSYSASKEQSIELENGQISAGDFKVQIPVEFVETAEGRYEAPDYANILISLQPYVGAIPAYPTENELKEQLEDEVQRMFSQEAVITVLGYEKYEIDGGNVLRFETQCDMDDIRIKQIQCMIVTKKELIIICYTDSPGEAWKDAFEESIASITIE